MPKRYSSFLSAWLLLCVLCFNVLAMAGTNLSGSPFIVDSWSTGEGLPQSSVISVIQTRDGYLWLGTLNGLVRFDGIHFTVFNENNTPGLDSDRIVYLFEDSHTNLWIGTDTGGVELVKNGKFQNLVVGGSGHEGRLVSACEDLSGAVWLYTADAHLARYQNGKLEELNFNFNLLPICRMIAAEKNGPIWVAEFSSAFSGLFAFRPENFHPPVIAIEQSISAERLDFILASRTRRNLAFDERIDPKMELNRTRKRFRPLSLGKCHIVTSACEDQDGNLIVGTLGAGVFWYDAEGSYRQISTDRGLSIRTCFPCAWIAMEISGWEPMAAA